MLRQCGAIVEARDIGRREHDAAIEFFRLLTERGEAFLSVAEIGSDDFTAGARQVLADFGAQAADAAGDHCYTFTHFEYSEFSCRMAQYVAPQRNRDGRQLLGLSMKAQRG